MIDLKANFAVKFLLEKLTANLEIHKKELEEARAGFFLEVQEQIEALQATMKEHPNTFSIPTAFRHLYPPHSHVEDYERAISMLSACHDTYLDLEADQYSAFVENKWSWRDGWTASNSAYISKSREVSL